MQFSHKKKVNKRLNIQKKIIWQSVNFGFSDLFIVYIKYTSRKIYLVFMRITGKYFFLIKITSNQRYSTVKTIFVLLNNVVKVFMSKKAITNMKMY